MSTPLLSTEDLAALQAIPAWETKPNTWLDIAGIGSRELSICQILRYYLDPGEDHGLGRTWLEALLSLLPGLPSVFDAFEHDSDITVETEVPTPKGRIDILLSAGEAGSKGVIAIEAKVWHWLANPLQDYEAFCNKRCPDVNVLVILSPYVTTEKNWKSITYSQLANTVEQRLGAELLQLNHHQSSFLQQFLQHLKAIAMDEVTKSAYQQFFHNHRAVARAAKLNNAVNDWIFSEVKLFAERNGWKREGVQEEWWCEIYNHDKSLCLEFAKRIGEIDAPYFSLKFWIKLMPGIESEAMAAELWRKTELLHQNLSIREVAGYGHKTDHEDWFVFGYRAYERLTTAEWVDFPQTLQSCFEKDFMQLIQAVAEDLKLPGLKQV